MDIDKLVEEINCSTEVNAERYGTYIDLDSTMGRIFVGKKSINALLQKHIASLAEVLKRFARTENLLYVEDSAKERMYYLHPKFKNLTELLEFSEETLVNGTEDILPDDLNKEEIKTVLQTFRMQNNVESRLEEMYRSLLEFSTDGEVKLYLVEPKEFIDRYDITTGAVVNARSVDEAYYLVSEFDWGVPFPLCEFEISEVDKSVGVVVQEYRHG